MPGAGESGERRLADEWVEFRVCEMKPFLQVGGGDACILRRTYLIPPNRALKMVNMVNVMFCIFCHNL